MVEEVLPHVPYAGVVFTIPKMLRGHFLWERKLYGDLSRGGISHDIRDFRARSTVILETFADPQAER